MKEQKDFSKVLWLFALPCFSAKVKEETSENAAFSVDNLLSITIFPKNLPLKSAQNMSV